MRKIVRERLFTVGCVIAGIFLLAGFVSNQPLCLVIGLVCLVISLFSNITMYRCKCGKTMVVRKVRAGNCKHCGEIISQRGEYI